MRELEWETLIDGESEIVVDDINKLAEYSKELNLNKPDASVVEIALKNKVDKIDGKGLSTNDYTDGDKEKLNNIEDGANKTVVDSELSEASTNPVQNKVTLEALNRKADSIINTASGEVIQLADSADERLKGLNIYGKTTQDGIPTPDTPIELNSIGNDGNVDVTITDEENNSQTFIVYTPNGLKGIAVASGGNYTDSNGQQWICDEVDFERGVYVQRIERKILTSDDRFIIQSVNSYGIVNFQLSPNITKIETSGNFVMCDHLKRQTTVAAQTMDEGVFKSNTVVYARLSQERCPDIDTLKSILSENPFTLYYVLKTPIETTLTEEQISAYKSLQTYKPITNITNDENAYMKVNYVADTKNYIDNKFAELQAMILEG